MRTHSSSVAWRIPSDSEAWQATVHRVAKMWPHMHRCSTFSSLCHLCPSGDCAWSGHGCWDHGDPGRTHSGITPQSLHSSFPPLFRPGDPHSFLGYICLWQRLSVSFSFHLDCHRSAASLSDSNVSPLTQTIALIWGLGPCFSSPFLPASPPKKQVKSY